MVTNKKGIWLGISIYREIYDTWHIDSSRLVLVPSRCPRSLQICLPFSVSHIIRLLSQEPLTAMCLWLHKHCKHRASQPNIVTLCPHPQQIILYEMTESFLIFWWGRVKDRLIPQYHPCDLSWYATFWFWICSTLELSCDRHKRAL